MINNIIINNHDGDDEGMNNYDNDNAQAEEEEVERLLNEEEMQEATIVYCLNLPVVQTAANNHPLNRNGDGIVKLYERSQFCKQARKTTLLIATYLLGYKQNLSHHVTQIARAACTLVAQHLKS